MKISGQGIALIKSFESCKLTAYKALSTEVHYTIGWGHYEIGRALCRERVYLTV